MKNILYITISLFFLNCSVNKTTTSEIEKINYSILEIDDFEYTYRFKGLNTQTHDTVYVLSFKQKMYDKYKHQKPKNLNGILDIKSKNDYIFSLIKMKTKVSTMQQLGQFIIIEKDTLWKGVSGIVPPKYYVAQNTVDLTYFK